MKVLLDENIDVRFKKLLESDTVQVFTVRDMSWNGIKNGELLSLLDANGFDCWIVADKNIPYQQNTANLPCSIIVLNVLRNTLKFISPLVPSVLKYLEEMGEIEVVVMSE